jgi:ATP phosphoribosyltransferase regulatory subunit
MTLDNRWLLPEGIEEVSPGSAWHLEQLRRDLLDLYHSWGYELVMPPFVEFLESLLTGTGSDLEMQTFKLIDPISGRQLGIRADMTPQAARIDARRSGNHAQRLCYLGTVLVTRSDGFGGSRSPMQVGAELYGHHGYESDLEIALLLLATLTTAGIKEVHLDLGHVVIFRSLVRQAGLDQEQEALLFEILQRKALPELTVLLDQYQLAPDNQAMLLALATLNGDRTVVDQARQQLAHACDDVHQALDNIERLTNALTRQHPSLPMHFDLAELRGYHYHTGLVFAAYVPGYGQEIARGGRYDSIGQVFGRARPATGFSSDLKTLLSLSVDAPDKSTQAIYAPAIEDVTLETKIKTLRDRHERVIRALPGIDDKPSVLGCNRRLIKRDGDWQVVPSDADNDLET